MRCDYFDAGRCRSCSLLDRPYDVQLAGKQQHVADLLARHRDLTWLEPVASREEGFRNKAKMVVAGTVEAPTLGILDATRTGIDLRECPLHVQPIRDALPVLAEFVTRAGLTPYDVAARRGELKHVLVTAAPDGGLMVRWVLRSDEAVPRIRKHLARLQQQLPGLRVVTANIQPTHKAILEGEREVVISEHDTLAMPVAGLPLALRPRSFFQTNTEVAARLYEQARDWVDEVAPASLWDLYCGVGGFALACAAPGREVLGVEVSEEAVLAARRTAQEAGLDVGFRAGDATTLLRDEPAPELVVVNPPRRGIGDLADWLEASEVRTVVYSSCHAESLARDLDRMPHLRPTRGRLLDMFPHTRHYEVLVQLDRA